MVSGVQSCERAVPLVLVHTQALKLRTVLQRGAYPECVSSIQEDRERRSPLQFPMGRIKMPASVR